MVATRTRSPVGALLVGVVLAALVVALGATFLLEDEDEPTGDAAVLTIAPEDGSEVPQVDLNGDPAPDFAYERLEGGASVDFEDFRDGRPAVINFFAEWCPPCVAEMPSFEDAYQEHGDEVAFLGLSYNESAEDGAALVERTGVTYETGRDPAGDIITAFSGLGMPTTVFIAADGTIVTSHTGAITPSELEEELEGLL
jgi:cytochrome c biogenesis protein CcmG, thiol:disulfide interchange protein DsbE